MPPAPFLRCVRRGNDKRTFSFAAIPRGVAVPVGVAHGVGHGFEARGFHVGNFHNEPLSKKLLD